MMFEVENLSQASPATVSRCGMVVMEHVDLGFAAMADSWAPQTVSAHIPQHTSVLVDLIKEHAFPAIAGFDKTALSASTAVILLISLVC